MDISRIILDFVPHLGFACIVFYLFNLSNKIFLLRLMANQNHLKFLGLEEEIKHQSHQFRNEIDKIYNSINKKPQTPPQLSLVRTKRKYTKRH